MFFHCRGVLLILVLALPGLAAAPASQPATAYSDLVSAYMGCEFDTLDEILRDRSRELAALPPQEAADVREIRLALTECRPLWWKTVKSGKKTALRAMLWGHTFAATYDPQCQSGMQIAITDGVPSLTVNWPAADMDSAQPDEHGFGRGDLTDLSIFSTLGAIDSWVAIPPAPAALDEAGKLALARYLDFRGNVAGLAYTNPAGRRWAVWLFLAGYQEPSEKSPTRMGRQALGALVIQEVLTRPGLYKSFQLPATLPAENAEQALASSLADFLEKHSWTLAEDMALRTAAKQFAAVNGLKAYNTGLVTLPNKLTLALDPEADGPLRPKRDAWVKEHFDEVAKQNP